MADYKDIFISYGRAESKAFATKLHDWLRAEDYQVWFDQNDIPLAVDFQNQIDEGIQKAHNFVFIIAPHSLRSVYCLKEILNAIRLGKRIIPILHIEPKEEEDWKQMHPTISKLNWLYFRQKYDPDLHQSRWEDIDDFGVAFKMLTGLLETNKAYVQWHTHILNEAMRWENKQRQPQFLLSGDEREQSIEWLLTDFKDEQPPCHVTDLQCEYVSESRKNAENLMADVFISAPSADRTMQERIGKALQRKGITTWTDADIKTGQRAREAAKTGILHADNFLFFLSTESVVSVDCLKQLKTAIKNQKRVIPLLIEWVDDYQIPRAARSLKRVDFTDNDTEEHFQLDIRDLFKEIKKDYSYYHQHKTLLARALKWEAQNRNESTLLREQMLNRAQTWLTLAEKRDTHKPLDLHREYVNQSLEKAGQIRVDVFLSYAPNESDFVRRLNDELQIHGKNTWFDQEIINVTASGAFQSEVEAGITDADNFVLVLSKKSVEDEDCRYELRHALKNNKRIIVVRYDDVPPWDTPEELKGVQSLVFEREKTDFHDAFSQLMRLLDTDIEHVRSHTRWLKEAEEWEQGERNPDFLLRGSEFALAEEWFELAKEKNRRPEPTKLQEMFIKQSREAIQKAQQEEEEQEQKVLQLERARVKEAQKRVRQQNILLIVVSIAFVITAVLGGLTYKQRQEAEEAKKNAEAVSIIAESKAEEAREAQQMSEKAQLELEEALLEVEEARQAAERALRRAGIAVNRRQEAERESSRVRQQAERELSEQEKREVEKFQELSRKLEKAKQDLQKAVNKMEAIGVIRPAVKRRLQELIEKEFNEAVVE